MTTRERILLGLSIVGFVVPNTMLAIYVIDHGTGGYFDHWFDSLPAAQLAADLGIAAIAFLLWAAWEGRRLGMRTWWVPIPASAFVGLCFGLPLFLLLRERVVRERGSEALAVSPGVG